MEIIEEHQRQDDSSSTGSSSPDEWSSGGGSSNDDDTTTDEDANVSVDSEYSHDDDERDRHYNDEENTQRKRRLLIISFLSGVLALLTVAFGLQLRELYNDSVNEDENPATDATTKQIQEMLHAKIIPNTRQKRLPIEDDETFTMPPFATRIYTHSALSSLNYRAGGVLSDEMIDQYERDGVLVVRNLISPLLLDRLQQAGDILLEEEIEENGTKGKRRGKQFHMVKNAVIFKGVPPPHSVESGSDDSNYSCTSGEESIGYCSSNSTTYAQSNNNNHNRTKITILSSFRDLAIYSKLPRVAASLLRLDELRVGGKENLNVGSKMARKRSRRKQLLEDGVDAEALDEDFEIDESINLRICRDM